MKLSNKALAWLLGWITGLQVGTKRYLYAIVCKNSEMSPVYIIIPLLILKSAFVPSVYIPLFWGRNLSSTLPIEKRHLDPGMRTEDFNFSLIPYLYCLHLTTCISSSFY